MNDNLRIRRQRARLDGADGEAVVSEYLTQKGYGLLAANYRYGHREIDLIMQQGKTVVFVEVKTRKSHALVEAPLAVNRNKQRLLYAAAANFLRTRGRDMDARFDIVWVESDGFGQKRVAGHIRNAFSPFGG